ncbi:MAG: hypothetical protein OSA47_00205 [Novosphingopyxis baekryungensis]|jgi:hypothetical protein|nr:hypothetical protein [Novosphingopyxis baekryungensis]
MMFMQQLDKTDFYIFTDAEADALKGGLADDMKSPSPIVPSGCGAMMRISEQDDVIFLEKALP